MITAPTEGRIEMINALITCLEKKYEAEWVSYHEGGFSIWTVSQGRSRWKVLDYEHALQIFKSSSTSTIMSDKK